MNVLLFGATGQVGQEILRAFAQHDRKSEFSVLAVHRWSEEKFSKLLASLCDDDQNSANSQWLHGSVKSMKTDYKNLEEEFRAVSTKFDVAITALGTTAKAAGSALNFTNTDYGLNFRFATLASDLKIPQFVLVSSAGANKDSYFLYPRVKGQLESDIQEKLSLKHVTIFRPMILLTKTRADRRPLETVMQRTVSVLDWWGNLSIRASDVGKAIVNCCVSPPGTAVTFLGNNQIFKKSIE